MDLAHNQNLLERHVSFLFRQFDNLTVVFGLFDLQDKHIFTPTMYYMYFVYFQMCKTRNRCLMNIGENV